MGLSSSKSKTTSAQDTKENATTTPTNPQWVTDQVQGQGQSITNFMARDPYSLVAGPSTLQERAFAGVQNLGGWQAGNQSAIGLAQGAGTAPAATASARGYGAPKLGAASQVGDVDARSHSLLDGLSNYMDPTTRMLVDATMASYDAQAGRQRAALMAEGARNSAFGGSRFGLAQSQFEADTGRNRALTDAELRANAFLQAASLSGQDAGRRQEAGLVNASLDHDRLATNANSDNDFRLSQAGMDAAAAQFGADAGNRVGMFNAAQEEAAQTRALQAAGLIGNLANEAGANSRADLGMTADLGAIQHAIDQAKAAAPATQLATVGQAMGAMPYNLFHGQNVNGTSSMTGTSTTKSKPSLFNQLLAAGQVASGF